MRKTPQLVLTQGGASHQVVEHFLARFAEAYLSELRDFVQTVQKRKIPGVTGQDGRRALAVALAAQRSYQESCPVAVPGDSGRVQKSAP
jgi:myo-inositol 2-dehydrogenase/D-chiro-inositol 1-dehydrogenase